MTEREKYLEKFYHLERAIQEGKVAEQLQGVMDSLSKKLAAERQNYEQMFEGPQGHITQPSMGVIETFVEKTPEPEYYFASDIRSRNRVRVLLSRASVDPETKEIRKGDAISEAVMTEKQFADVISNPNRGSGFPVTQTVKNGDPIAPYDATLDPTKSAMKDLLEAATTPDHLDKQLEEVNALLESAEDTGRISKKEIDAVKKTMKAGIHMIVANGTFRVDRVTEEISKLATEASLAVHLDVRSHGKMLTKKGDD